MHNITYISFKDGVEENSSGKEAKPEAKPPTPEI